MVMQGICTQTNHFFDGGKQHSVFKDKLGEVSIKELTKHRNLTTDL